MKAFRASLMTAISADPTQHPVLHEIRAKIREAASRGDGHAVVRVPSLQPEVLTKIIELFAEANGLNFSPLNRGGFCTFHGWAHQHGRGLSKQLHATIMEALWEGQPHAEVEMVQDEVGLAAARGQIPAKLTVNEYRRPAIEAGLKERGFTVARGEDPQRLDVYWTVLLKLTLTDRIVTLQHLMEEIGLQGEDWELQHVAALLEHREKTIVLPDGRKVALASYEEAVRWMDQRSRNILKEQNS